MDKEKDQKKASSEEPEEKQKTPGDKIHDFVTEKAGALGTEVAGAIAKKSFSNLVNQAQEVTVAADKYVKANPYAFIAGALLLGFFIGLRHEKGKP